MTMRAVLSTISWLENAKLLHKIYDWSTPETVFRRLRPGDLLFWEDTFDARRNPNIMHGLRPASPLDRADYASHRADPAASREAKSTVDSHADTRDTRQVEQDVDFDKRHLSAPIGRVT